RRPELDAIQTEEALQRSCVDLGPPGYDTGFGWGFVNALGALRTLDSACRVLVLADGDALTALRFPGREPLWSLAFAELARRPWIVPTAGGAVVLVSAGGATFGIDLATGEILWSRAGECSVSDSLRDTYGQLYTDEVAFPYGPPRLSAGGAPSVLLVDAAAGGTTTVLLDTRTGADIWSRTEQSGSHGSAFIPRSDGSYDVTFRALSTGEMMRIDGRTGEAIVWARSLPHYIGVPIPDVTNDGEYDLFARADATDEMLWLDGAAGGTRFSMAFGAFGVVGVQAIRNASNSVHVLAAAQSSAGGGIRRIRINGGGSLWECSSAYNDQTLRGTIRRVDGRVTVLSGRRHAGTAVAIDADTGAALWDHVPTNDPDAFPMGAGLDATGDGNEDVLSRGADGLLRVYDGLTGGLDAGFPPLAASGGAATTIVDLPPACAADVNADGAVDTRDVVEFLNAWAAGDSRADFTGDGAVDSRDVIAFLNAWSAGCP
ncbi:MAG TPA: GC-type dockerin domain-anchored protein, partial [Phycisphaerales bacterium]|nr:GC-type dockerin domain-anchored protein [Phycisphaerales bacterium]